MSENINQIRKERLYKKIEHNIKIALFNENFSIIIKKCKKYT